jgi:small GTP-binding protein
LAQTFEAVSGITEPPAELYPTLRRLHQLFLAQPQLAPLGAEVVQIKEVFDRPLLVTVMGEFNSGKSTFVNALIGEKVAPMGVTPTTATINVLKYGQQRAGRILWRDDQQDQLKWEEIGPFLRSLDKHRTREIRLVELLYPAEELLRVNVVDTPGLNSMIDEHEQTAREFMGQADAVVWLFSAQQAGKRTEQDALSFLRQHRLKTVGVLNKVDQLDADQLERVSQHLEQEFSELVDAVVPVSARQALDAMVARQQQALEQSRFPELRRFLEQQLFDRSRKIKADAALMRLEGILQRGRRHVEQTLVLADNAIEQLHSLQAQVDQEFRYTRSDPKGREDPEFTDKVLSDEGQRLREALQDLFRQGAEEVLDFVRPRRWLFGEHRASPADRDFLLDSLEDGLHHMSARSWTRISDHLTSTWQQLCDQISPYLESDDLAPLTPWLDTTTQLVQARNSLLKQQVYTRFNAFTRGLLRGGRVDHFFSHKLPNLDLKAPVIQDALIGDGVDLEGELLHPLSTWYEEAASLLVLQIERLRQDLDLLRMEHDRRLLAPILHYLGQLPSWQAEGKEAEGKGTEDNPGG